VRQPCCYVHACVGVQCVEFVAVRGVCCSVWSLLQCVEFVAVCGVCCSVWSLLQCVEFVAVCGVCCSVWSLLQCVEFVVGLVTSLSASFSRWRASSRDRRGVDSNSVASDQSLLSAVSDMQPPAPRDADMDSIDCNTSLRPLVAATPKVIGKRRAGNEAQPFSASKKLVLRNDISLLAATVAS